MVNRAFSRFDDGYVARPSVTGRTCPRDGAELRPGIAIAQTYTGEPEWPGAEVVTMSPGGPGRLIGCWKCPTCGMSFAYARAV